MNIDRELYIKSFTYSLPDEKIARYPLTERDGSKLLVYRNGEISDDYFFNLAGHLDKDTLLVFNNTRVIRARLLFRKPSGATVEIFCLEPSEPAEYQQSFASTGSCTWHCLVGNLRRWKEDTISKLSGYKGTELILTARKAGNDRIEFRWTPSHLSFAEVLQSQGAVPIPPYLSRDAEEIDNTRYQTVYALPEGSVAAPTAGLHFTGKVLADIAGRGIMSENLTLHVGAGTFIPVKSASVSGHEMHPEHFFISAKTLKNIAAHIGKITAVGTTSVRAVESLYWIGVKLIINPSGNISELDQWEAYDLPQDIPVADVLTAVSNYMEKHSPEQFEATTRLIIIPGYRFRLVNTLITNFHQPESTLLLLVAAFTGHNWRRLYDHALGHSYRFLSYGDSSLIFRE